MDRGGRGFLLYVDIIFRAFFVKEEGIGRSFYHNLRELKIEK